MTVISISVAGYIYVVIGLIVCFHLITRYMYMICRYISYFMKIDSAVLKLIEHEEVRLMHKLSHSYYQCEYLQWSHHQPSQMAFDDIINFYIK